MKHLFRSWRGFTLVEMLVVISVIAILMSMGMAAYGTARKAGRDAKRRADLKQAQTAMEQFFTTNSSSYLNGCTGMNALFSGNVPVDPLTGAALGCGITGGGTGYCINTDVERDDGNCTVSGSTCSFVNTNAGTHFCLTNVQ